MAKKLTPGRIIMRIVVPAGASRFPIRAPFVPDWWRVVLAEYITGTIRVYPSSTVALGSQGLTGTGQWAFPGEGDRDDSILIDNPTGATVQLDVYASAAFPPDSYTPPFSLAKPLSLSLKAQAQLGDGGVAGTTLVFTIQHTGGPIFLFTYVANSTAFRIVSSVSFGGTAGAVVGIQNSIAGFHRAELWTAGNVPTGPVQITVTFAASVSDKSAFAFSFDPSVFAGSPAGTAANDANPHNLTLTATEQLAAGYIIAGCSVAFDETSGAVLVAEIPDSGALNHIVRIYNRAMSGPGTTTFILDPTAIGALTALGAAAQVPNT